MIFKNYQPTQLLWMDDIPSFCIKEHDLFTVSLSILQRHLVALCLFVFMFMWI